MGQNTSQVQASEQALPLCLPTGKLLEGSTPRLVYTGFKSAPFAEQPNSQPDADIQGIVDRSERRAPQQIQAGPWLTRRAADMVHWADTEPASQLIESNDDDDDAWFAPCATQSLAMILLITCAVIVLAVLGLAASRAWGG